MGKEKKRLLMNRRLEELFLNGKKIQIIDIY